MVQEASKPVPGPRATAYIRYVAAMERGGLYSRSTMADWFGVDKSTARVHLERGVKEGVLERVVGNIGQQTGWLYGIAGTIPQNQELWPDMDWMDDHAALD